MTAADVVPVDRLTHADAKRLTTRIALALDTMATAYERVMPLIREAIERDAATALGYSGVSEYVAAEFGDSLTRVGVEMRRDVVRELTEGGMSTRAIAPVVGVNHSTVVRDLATGADAPVAPASITGLNGKTYSAPVRHLSSVPTRTSGPRRRPLTDGFRDATLDLGKVVTRVSNLVADDRYPRNRDEVARYASDLIRARDALQCVINQMSQQEGTS